MSDQATILRALAAKQGGEEPKQNHNQEGQSSSPNKAEKEDSGKSGKRARIITITSGKGGVGKTNTSAALSYYLHTKGRRVLLVDFDFGMGNTDLLLGNTDKKNITQLLKDGFGFKEAIVSSRYGFEFVKGVRDVRFADLPKHLLNKFVSAFREIECEYDDIVIDTGAGAHHIVIQSVMRADVKLFVIKPERSSWEDAYQIVKHLKQKGYSKGFKIFINMARNKQVADLTAKNFQLTCEKSLKIEVEYIGYLLDDENISESVRNGEVFLARHSQSSAALLFQDAFKGFEEPKANLRARNVSYFEALLGT